MDKDIGILKHIIGHIEDALNAQKRFGNDYTIFISDKDYFNSVYMSLLQMGELAIPTLSGIGQAGARAGW